MTLCFGTFWNFFFWNTFDLRLVDFVESEPAEKGEKSRLYLTIASQLRRFREVEPSVLGQTASW